jgi:hypothetical protein
LPLSGNGGSRVICRREIYALSSLSGGRRRKKEVRMPRLRINALSHLRTWTALPPERLPRHVLVKPAARTRFSRSKSKRLLAICREIVTTCCKSRSINAAADVVGIAEL